MTGEHGSHWQKQQRPPLKTSVFLFSAQMLTSCAQPDEELPKAKSDKYKQEEVQVQRWNPSLRGNQL